MTMREQVQEIIELLREALQRDGGDIALIDVNEETGEVLVELQGTCAGCPYSQITLTSYVEKALKENVPGVTKVRNRNLQGLNI